MGNQTDNAAGSNVGCDNQAFNEIAPDRTTECAIDLRSPTDSNLAQFLKTSNSQPPYLNNLQIDASGTGTTNGAITYEEVGQPERQENIPEKPPESQRPVPEAKLPPIRSTMDPKLPSIDDLLKPPQKKHEQLDPSQRGMRKGRGHGDGTPPGEAKPMRVRGKDAGKAPVTDTQLEALSEKYQISPKYRISPKLLFLERDRAEREDLHTTFTNENLERLLRVAQKHRLIGDFNEQGLHSQSRPGAFMGKLIPELLRDPDSALTKGQTRMKDTLAESMRAGLADQSDIDQAMRNVDRKIASVRTIMQPFIEDLKRELRKPRPRTDGNE